jgi:ferrochelatase
VDEIKKGLKAFNSSLIAPNSSLSDVHVLFSAHSLPVKFIEEGDPYVDQIKGTINEIVKKINISWSLSYQSKSGPVQWLGPSTDKMIEDLAAQGKKNILVVPVSFVSDHIETLYEIDILYKTMAEKLGMRFERVASLNTSPLFISAMRDIVLKGMREAGWLE